MLWFPTDPLPLNPILKVPLVLSGTYLVHRGYLTPPHPPADKSATSAYGEKRDVMSRPNAWRWTDAVKIVYWLNAVAESAILIGSRYPSYLPPQLLQILLREPQRNVSDISVTPVWLSGCLLMMAGGLLRLSCYRTMDRFFTWDLAIKDDHKLITSGPYSVVRHPGYIAAAMIGVGTLMCHLGKGSWFVSYGGLETFWGRAFTLAWSSLVIFTPTMLCSRVNIEDEVLHKQFGQVWEDYARKTPYKLIPYVY